MFLDQRPLYNALNLSVPASFAYNTNWYHALDPNQTVVATRLSVLNCPSDGGSPRELPTTNYAGTTGYGFTGTGRIKTGVFDDSGASVSPAKIGDGLSNTVAFSEWVVGTGTAGGSDRLGNIYHTPPIDDFERFVAACDSGVGFIEDMQPKGKWCLWLNTFPGNTLYDHNQGVGKLSCSDGNGGFLKSSSRLARRFDNKYRPAQLLCKYRRFITTMSCPFV